MNSQRNTIIWDLPTRLFHRLLVLVVALQFLTGLIGGDWLTLHAYLGYATLTLIIFRVLWGFLGGYWSLFSTFVPTPKVLLNYARTFSRSNPRTPNNSEQDSNNTPLVGHNPLGAISVLAMLLLLTLQIISGVMSNDDISFAGPFTSKVSNDTVEFMTWYHSCVGFYSLIFLISLHIFAILFYKFVMAQNLTFTMVHGYKKIEASVEASIDTKEKRLIALALFCLSALIVYLLLSLT